MKKILLGILLILVLIVAGCSGGIDVDSLEPSGELDNGIRVITATAFKYNFDPNPIVVNQGERVKIIMTSTDVPHGFLLPDYNIDVPLSPGRPTTIEFVADKQGTFKFLCSVVCGSGHGSMKGKLVVK